MGISRLFRVLIVATLLGLTVAGRCALAPTLAIRQADGQSLLVFSVPAASGTVAILQATGFSKDLPWTAVHVSPAASEAGEWPLPRNNAPAFFKVEFNPNPIPPNMLWISPGSFLMGSPLSDPDAKPDEYPQHEVTMERGFWLCRFEVTQREYEAVMGASNNRSVGKAGPDSPVDSVSWFNATNYCARLTQSEGDLGRLPRGYVYRLPTEAEWEYACRAGTQTRYNFGDSASLLDDNVWWSENGGSEPHPVGEKPPNRWGLYDMHGNVFEWCLDWYVPYPGSAVGTLRGCRIVRGGAFYCPKEILRSACRNHSSLPQTMSYVIGFRVALAPVVSPQ